MRNERSVINKARRYTMRKVILLLGLVGILVYIGACQETRPDRNYVQANIVDKSLFEGEWYYARTIIDHDYESSWAGYYGLFKGDMTYDMSIGVIARIRFVIDEDYLYAYRSYEIVSGAEPDGSDPEYIGEPIAVWRIEKHLDIVRRYNPTTGEELNVIEENDRERPWYERKYMRVDWSENLVTGYYWNSLDMYGAFNYIERQPAPTYVGEGSPFPDQWEPQFFFTPNAIPSSSNEPGKAAFFEEFEKRYYDMYGPGQVYGMSFVSREIWSPREYCLLYDWYRPSDLQGQNIPCTSFMVTIRNFFLKVPKDDQYEPILITNSLWDRFGVIRMEQPTYLNGNKPDKESGLTDYYGQTDFLNYWGARHNIWKKSYEDVENEDGTVSRKPIPLGQREVIPVVYTLGAHFPPYLVYPSFEVIGEWNGVLMETIRLNKQLYGGSLPQEWLTDIKCNTNLDCHSSRAGDHAWQQPYSICYKTGDQEEGVCTAPLPDKFIVGSSCESDDECREKYGNEYPDSRCEFPYPGAKRMCTRHYNPFKLPDPSQREFDCYVVNGNGEPVSDPGKKLDSFNDPSFNCEQNPLTCPYSYHFVGSECALILRVNSCDNPKLVDAYRREYESKGQQFNPELICDQLGDLRHNFFYYIDVPGAWFAGVTIPMMDPENGRLVVSPVHITEDSIQSYITSLLNQICLVAKDERGERLFDWCENREDEEYYMSGEDIREYFANQGYAIPPVGVIAPVPTDNSDVLPRGDNSPVRRFQRYLQKRMEEAQKLRGTEGRAKIYHDRLRLLQGTRFEDMLYGNNEAMISMGLAPSENIYKDEILDHISIFRNSFPDLMTRQVDFLKRMTRHYMEPSPAQMPPYVDNSILNIATKELKGLSKREVAVWLARKFFRGVMLHEMGHALGMEHNFAASMDYNNYHNPFYLIDQEKRLPSREDFDRNRDGELSYEEAVQFRKEMERIRLEREKLGIVRWRGSSVMDYYGRWAADLAPLGKYDKAFIHFLYGNQVELYMFDPHEDALPITLDTPRNWLERSDLVPRIYESFFKGGEKCRAKYERTSDGRIVVVEAHHEDCPYSEGSPNLPPGQIVTQKCVAHPSAIHLSDPDSVGGVCESYYQAVERIRNENRRLDIYPVQYLFCSNNRLNDISWCNWYDDGESYQQIVASFRDRFYRFYPFTHFRRFREDWNGTSYWMIWSILAKIHQHFYYRLYYEWEDLLWSGRFEDNYRDLIGVWRHVVDMFEAAADVMNFLAEVVTMPAVGSYEFDPVTQGYHIIEYDNLGLSDLDIPLGVGRYMWSAYQTGHQGFFRLERMGMIWDKIEALYALALRDWGTSWTYDERFWINMYSLFPDGMSRLFGGLIIGDPKYFGPRICKEGEIAPDGTPCRPNENGLYPIYYLDLFHGDCEVLGGRCVREEPQNSFYGRLPAIDGVANDLLRTFAAVFSLAEFPIFYDPEYEMQLYVFVKGSGDSFTLPEELHGCGIENVESGWEGCDYVEYHSNRLNRTYVAMHIEPRSEDDLPIFSISFEMLKFANKLKYEINKITECQENNDLCGFSSEKERDDYLYRVRKRLESTESFLENLRDIQAIYGITSWL